MYIRWRLPVPSMLARTPMRFGKSAVSQMLTVAQTGRAAAGEAAGAEEAAGAAAPASAAARESARRGRAMRTLWGAVITGSNRIGRGKLRRAGSRRPSRATWRAPAPAPPQRPPALARQRARGQRDDGVDRHRRPARQR